jgi:hypothetical protein
MSSRRATVIASPMTRHWGRLVRLIHDALEFALCCARGTAREACGRISSEDQAKTEWVVRERETGRGFIAALFLLHIWTSPSWMDVNATRLRCLPAISISLIIRAILTASRHYHFSKLHLSHLFNCINFICALKIT